MAPPQRHVQVSLQTVTPSIPENRIALAELKKDLRVMKCADLLEQSWVLKREELVHELLLPERPNIFDTIV